MTIDTDVLADLQAGRIHLDRGAHDSRDEGHCAMEVVAWLAGEGHTDAPQCASPVLTAYTIRLNDRWGDTQRQALAPYLPRMVGTRDRLDGARLEIARRALVADLLPPWLRLAGMDAEADAISTVNLADLRTMLDGVRVAAWGRRDAALGPIRERVRAAVREELAQRPAVAADAVAVAVAVAVAIADAAVAAAADVVAVVAAVAAAVADAAVAAAVAADAAVAAAADAVADAVAVAAVAAAVAVAASWSGTYWPVYEVVKPIFAKAIEDGGAPKLVAVRELAAAQRGMALDLLDRMIKPEVAAR